MPKPKNLRARAKRVIRRSFSELRFPARPHSAVNRRVRESYKTLDDFRPKIGLPKSINPAYVSWLESKSMLHKSERLARAYSGKASMWRNPFGDPNATRAVKMSSVWYTAYPASLITKNNESPLRALASPELWDMFHDIGITGVHTGPMKLAGGMNGWEYTPSIDGHFDRISNLIDPIFGTEKDYLDVTHEAQRRFSTIIGDIIPGHTGKGPDYKLATMHYKDYPGIYHIIEIERKDWHLLPTVPKNKDSVNIDQKTEKALKEAGYIVGALQRVIFYEPGVKETNWSVTKEIRGVDGHRRRWVYLHYFKDGQPSINWLDPSFAGIKLVIGDIIHSVEKLNTKGLRLDANGYLGLEVGQGDSPAWSEGHPLSATANELIAGMIRKIDGFSFQELNLEYDDISKISQNGADLSYDFINRPAYHHALTTGDTEFLRLNMREAVSHGYNPAQYVHALQNHDELTFEMVHYLNRYKNKLFTFRGKELQGGEIRDIVRAEMTDRLTGKNAPYNLPFTTNGIASTMTSFIGAALGYQSLHDLPRAEIDTIIDAHMLLAMFNALQPGVFALSGWDLTGSITLDKKTAEPFIGDGDTRWINRGSYDLMGVNPSSQASSMGVPRVSSLYGTLPEQMEDTNSFALRLKHLLVARKDLHIATGTLVDIPDVIEKSVFVMVHSLKNGHKEIQATVLNFSKQQITAYIQSDYFTPKARVIDSLNGDQLDSIDEHNGIHVTLKPFGGASLLVE